MRRDKEENLGGKSHGEKEMQRGSQLDTMGREKEGNVGGKFDTMGREKEGNVGGRLASYHWGERKKRM